MILACPNCATRYVLAATSLGAAGRKVRCARCAHTWFEAAPAPDLAAPEPAPEFVPPARPPDLGAYRGTTLPARLDQPRRHPLRAGWALLVLLVAGAGGVAYAARAEITRVWPPAALLYETLGVEVAGAPLPAADMAVAGLAIRGLEGVLDTAADPPVLRVRGEIVNDSHADRELPHLSIILADGAQRPLDEQRVALDRPRLTPGEVIAFDTAFARPDPAAALVIVSAAGAD